MLTWAQRLLRVRGLKEGFAGHPGVPKGPAALSLLDLLLTRDLSPPDGLSPRHWLHTQVGRVPLGRKGKDGHWFPCKRPYYPDNELKTPPAVGPCAWGCILSRFSAEREEAARPAAA